MYQITKSSIISVASLFAASFAFTAQAAEMDGSPAYPFRSATLANFVSSAGVYHFNIGGLAFSTLVSENGDIVFYTDFIPTTDGNNPSIGQAGRTPRTTAISTDASKLFLNDTILAQFANENPTSLRIVSKHPNGTVTLDAVTQNDILINRALSNRILWHARTDDNYFISQGHDRASLWDGDTDGGQGPQMWGASCYRSGYSNNTPLTDRIMDLCGNGNGIWWAPASTSSFALDFYGANNSTRVNDGIFGEHKDEGRQLGDTIQLLFRFPFPEPQLEVIKTSSLPVGSLAQVGDEVTYTYTITNTGFVPVQNVTMSDDHRSNGSFTQPAIESATLTDNFEPSDSVNTDTTNGVYDKLGPGDVLTVTATYTITEADTALAN